MDVTAAGSRRESSASGSPRLLKIRGAAAHNLRKLNLDLPLGKWIALCGVSGSGKTSLAVDTLYAEGQRRYLESFSVAARQFLEKLDKPEVESITGLPPAIAVTAREYHKQSRSTVGSGTELDDYLRLLFAKLATPYCTACRVAVQRYTPHSAAQELAALPAGQRLLIGVEMPSLQTESELNELSARLRAQGYQRVLWQGALVTLDQPLTPADRPLSLLLIIDRLTTGGQIERLRETCEAAWRVQTNGLSALVAGDTAGDTLGPTRTELVDGVAWSRWDAAEEYRCGGCATGFPLPQPKLFNYNNPLGACPTCEGFGNRLDWDLNLIVPDRRKTLREGAIVPWNTPAYAHELTELLALADDYQVPVDVPFAELTARQLELVMNGVPERNFGGLRGFQAWLERRKYKLPIRVLMSRFRSTFECNACQGKRWNDTALSYRVNGRNLAEWSATPFRDWPDLLETLSIDGESGRPARLIVEQMRNRLRYLARVGLDYLTPARPLRTLSAGEAQRVALTAALGSSLVNVLYVLDEPTLGMHAAEVPRMIEAVTALRDRGNTVLAVEHEEQMLRSADHLVEIGPGAGERGGQIVFDGIVAELIKNPVTATGGYLAGERYQPAKRTPRDPRLGRLHLTGARGHNLRQVTVDIALGTLTVICGVSASGKTTLLTETLYPALCKRKDISAPEPLPFDSLSGERSVDDVILIDGAPIGRSPRSNPATYLKIWDEIRKLFAETPEAKARGFGPGHFSFNVADGRCETCEGDGYQRIDMQFMADVYRKCPTCHGKRFRAEILKVEYRARTIADMLELTVREAFTFFRGATHIQSKLKQLIDVGLEYLRLGQPANTLSGGESQRLKLAGYIAALKRSRTLFILDEPSSGLHFADVAQLLECFTALLDVGHSLIVADHHPLILHAADQLIELGPGPADEGGQIIATGTPQELARLDTPTGRLLAK